MAHPLTLTLLMLLLTLPTLGLIDNCFKEGFDKEGRKDCKECNEGYFASRDRYSCIRCVRGCRMCTNANSCILCQPEFFMHFGGECKKCSRGCLQCTNEHSCQQCKKGSIKYTQDGIDVCESIRRTVLKYVLSVASIIAIIAVTIYFIFNYYIPQEEDTAVADTYVPLHEFGLGEDKESAHSGSTRAGEVEMARREPRGNEDEVKISLGPVTLTIGGPDEDAEVGARNHPAGPIEVKTGAPNPFDVSVRHDNVEPLGKSKLLTQAANDLSMQVADNPYAGGFNPFDSSVDFSHINAKDISRDIDLNSSLNNDNKNLFESKKQTPTNTSAVSPPKSTTPLLDISKSEEKLPSPKKTPEVVSPPKDSPQKTSQPASINTSQVEAPKQAESPVSPKKEAEVVVAAQAPASPPKSPEQSKKEEEKVVKPETGAETTTTTAEVAETESPKKESDAPEAQP